MARHSASMAFLACLAALSPMSAMAQGEGWQEIVVTAMRRDADDYENQMPAVGLTRRADFAVVGIEVSGDSRDKAQREEEIYAMIRSAIEQAQRSGVTLAFGERTLQPLTLANYRELTLENDRRPDSQRTGFLIKVALSETRSAADAQADITRFVKSVKPVGRALMEESEDMTLSLVAPDQYRGAIADAIAADAQAMAGRLGDGYAVQIEGLNRPVEWARSGLSNVFLYVPYTLTVLPRP